MKKCNAANCGYNVFSNGFCIRHQHLRDDEKYVLKKNKPSILKKPKQATSKTYRIKKISTKMSKSLKVYHLKRMIFLGEKTLCEIRVNGCTNTACDVHHTKSRGKYLNDVNTWLASCRSCHDWVHNNTKEATELGFYYPPSKR